MPDSSCTSSTALRELFDCALQAVSADEVMPQELPLPPGRLVVLAVGKGAAEMMRVAQERAKQPFEGLLIGPHGYGIGRRDWGQVEWIEASHPHPDENSVRGADRALEIARSLGAGDHMLVLLSGGGSALLAAPVDGVTLADKQSVTKLLLRSGATISEINCVRKHLSRIKGGRLALAAGEAQVTTWIISDVPGDDPSFVSSGPTVADLTTLQMARDIVAKYRIDPPRSVIRALADSSNETPAPDSPGLERAENRVVTCAGDALAAAAVRAAALGFTVTSLGDKLEDEARQLGADHAALARRLSLESNRRVILSGGETTVKVVNPQGRGGRNMEYALSLAIALNGSPGIWALACDTDGIDGTEDAAGALITPDTLERARAAGLDPAQYLAENNAYIFFEALDDLVITGPTGTNVNDFRAILVEGEA